MSLKSLKTWSWLHKWSSLICTVFLLMLCITGIPLIFYEEINEWSGKAVKTPDLPDSVKLASMDDILASAKALYPELAVQFVFRDSGEEKTWTVSLGKTPTSEDNIKQVVVDSRTAKVLSQPKFDEGFMYIMFKLHVDLFAGLPGMLFLGFMGLLFVIAIISGVVLYAPFMRRLDFGQIRQHRTPKLKRLDIHNFIGITTLVWMLVVGVTGIINAWSDLVIKYWQFDQMSAMTAPYKGLPKPTQFAPLQASVEAAQAREPNMRLGFIAFPGTDFSSPHHYGMFMRGDSPLTSRLFKPVLIDARTSKLTDSREVPWYLATLLISQPLHFGDYGGLPLKFIWLVFDMMTIVVLWTGLMLWWKKLKLSRTEILSRLDRNKAFLG